MDLYFDYINFNVLGIIIAKLDCSEFRSLGVVTNLSTINYLYLSSLKFKDELQLISLEFPIIGPNEYEIINCTVKLRGKLNLGDNLREIYDTKKLLLSSPSDKNKRISSLPNEIGNLHNLEVVDISWNRFTEFPPSLLHLTNLTKLDLSHNNISEIPPKIGNLVNLIMLGLNSNRINKIPEEMGNLTKLERVNLNFNPLAEMPTILFNLPNIVVIELNHTGRLPGLDIYNLYVKGKIYISRGPLSLKELLLKED